MKNIVAACVILISAAGPVCAGKTLEREISCQVCGRVFYARLDVPGSDAESDMRLDLKPTGNVPAPRRLPDCPGCGFVTYMLDMPKAELEKCRAITASAVYKKCLKRSPFFRVGVLYSELKKPAYEVAESFLKASWQEEADPVGLKEDLELSLKYFTACAEAAGTAVEERENSQLLMGELLRRLGRFEESAAHLKKLQGIKGFQNNFFGEIVAYQLKLCSKRDSSVHDMEDVRFSKKSLMARLKRRLGKWLKKYKSDK
ncbi:MAG: hypothetical protein WCW52_00755 [Elusimicrobiales bacterium]|jgi:hypothetical protein